MSKEKKTSAAARSIPALAPDRAKSVYQELEIERNAKNEAYLFILTNNLFERFVEFSQRYDGDDPHADVVNYLYYLSLNK